MNLLSKNLLDIFSKYESNVLFKDCGNNQIFYADLLKIFIDGSFCATKKKLVLCLADNTIGGLSGYLSLLAANAVPLMASPSASAETLKALVLSYRPSFVWLPEFKKNNFENSKYLVGFHGYCLLFLGDHDLQINESLALMLSTSGSTGSSKYVRLSDQNVFSNASSIARYLELTSSDLPITTLPPSYSYGLSVIHSHIIVGASIAVTSKNFFDREFWNFFHKAGVSSFSGVPYHYEILKKLRFFKMQLPSLRTLTQAGGRMDVGLTKEFALHCENHGIKFFTMYGQTEATARISFLPPQKAIDKIGSVGIAIPDTEIWLEDLDGKVINSEGITGELVCRGGHVSMGYAENYEDLARGDDLNGVLRTGDLARFDADGDFYVVGRLARFIKLFGFRINLAEVEEFLHEMGYVAACSGSDSQLEVYVESLKEGQAEQLKLKIMGYLQVAASGVAIFSVINLPRNSSHKICYSDLTPDIGNFLV